MRSLCGKEKVKFTHSSKQTEGSPYRGLDRPLGLQEVEACTLHDSRHMKVVSLSAVRTDRLYLLGDTSWYSFLLEDDSTPGPQCGRKDYVNEKF
jgi:hypothetical protein